LAIDDVASLGRYKKRFRIAHSSAPELYALLTLISLFLTGPMMHIKLLLLKRFMEVIESNGGSGSGWRLLTIADLGQQLKRPE
jgi:hypothetical protein